MYLIVCLGRNISVVLGSYADIRRLCICVHFKNMEKPA